jgi:non-ribosomal peptide synthetase component E (peptide arylation enzyme)
VKDFDPSAGADDRCRESNESHACIARTHCPEKEAGLPGSLTHDRVTSGERRRHYLANGLWDETTLPGRVARWAHEQGDAVAVVDSAGERRRSYRELQADAMRLAVALAEQEISAGEVVSVQLPNRYEAVVAAVAVLSLGAVINPLLPNYRARELGHVWSRARPRAVLTPDHDKGFDHVALVNEVSRATGHRPWHVVVGDAGGDARLAEILDRPNPVRPAATAGEARSGSAGDVSELIFTSGTEALPKAILHSEQTANFSVRVAFEDLGMSKTDVVWMPSPVGHSTGFNYGLRFALYHGLPLVLQDVWDAEAAADLVAREGCTYTLAATTFLQDLIEAAARNPERTRSLRRFGCGGAPVPPELVDAAHGLGIEVLRLYGSTEVLVGSWNRPGSPLRKRLHTDGLPMRHVEIVCLREDGTPCDVEEPGEIFTRGPNTSIGLFEDPERSAAIFDPQGWVRSGDQGILDADGYLTVVGRIKEIIIRGGLNIAPREIEDLLLRLPQVERAAVVGLPDPRLGERSCACLVLRAGASLDLPELCDRLLADGLAKYKLPERLEIFEALPQTASGKIQKHRIRSELAQRQAETPAEKRVEREALA